MARQRSGSTMTVTAATTSWSSRLERASSAPRSSGNSTGALAQLAEIRRAQGQLDEAIRLFAEALEIDDSQPSLFMGVGDVLQRAGRYEQAVQAFEHVLELEPDSFKARYNLGVTYSNMGRAEEAVAIYEQALGLKAALATLLENR